MCLQVSMFLLTLCAKGVLGEPLALPSYEYLGRLAELSALYDLPVENRLVLIGKCGQSMTNLTELLHASQDEQGCLLNGHLKYYSDPLCSSTPTPCIRRGQFLGDLHHEATVIDVSGQTLYTNFTFNYLREYVKWANMVILKFDAFDTYKSLEPLVYLDPEQLGHVVIAVTLLSEHFSEIDREIEIVTCNVHKMLVERHIKTSIPTVVFPMNCPMNDTYCNHKLNTAKAAMKSLWLVMQPRKYYFDTSLNLHHMNDEGTELLRAVFEEMELQRSMEDSSCTPACSRWTEYIKTAPNENPFKRKTTHISYGMFECQMTSQNDLVTKAALASVGVGLVVCFALCAIKWKGKCKYFIQFRRLDIEARPEEDKGNHVSKLDPTVAQRDCSTDFKVENCDESNIQPLLNVKATLEKQDNTNEDVGVQPHATEKGSPSAKFPFFEVPECPEDLYGVLYDTEGYEADSEDEDASLYSSPDVIAHPGSLIYSKLHAEEDKEIEHDKNETGNKTSLSDMAEL